ncbi:MAG: (deoxy)nucleoside triphosphate pyrophosphohydrolase [Candidatus Aminicenantales bacterium]
MTKVAAAIMEKDGKVLIAKRKRGDRQEGLWEFPGGKIERGETPEHCLQRELREEFGIEIKVGQIFCVHAHRTPALSIELNAYEVSHLEGEFRLREHSEIQWVSPQELDAYSFSEPDIPVVRKLKHSLLHKARTLP